MQQLSFFFLLFFFFFFRGIKANNWCIILDSYAFSPSLSLPHTFWQSLVDKCAVFQICFFTSFPCSAFQIFTCFSETICHMPYHEWSLWERNYLIQQHVFFYGGVWINDHFNVTIKVPSSMLPPSDAVLVNLWCQWRFSDNDSEAEYGKK